MKIGAVLSFDEADVFMADQLKDLKLDIIGIHPWGGNRAVEGIDKTIERCQTAEYKEFARIIRGSGKKIEFEAHAHSWLFPKGLFQDHPQWFREDAAGKRSPDFNMCVSNKEALSFLADRAALLAEKLPSDTGKYCWWTDDIDGDCFCHCPACRELSPSDQYMLWCHAVLSGIRRTDPAAALCYLAYSATIEAPRKVKPAGGIFLEFAPFRRDSFIPINNGGCEQNRKEIASLPELINVFGAKDSRILEYWLDNSRFSGFKKPYRRLQFDPEIMQRDVAYYRSLGFEYFTCFACFIGREYQREYSPPDYGAYVRAFG